jgi:hypothetical protein
MPQTKLLANPTYARNFGFAVAISLDGNVAAVGDVNDSHTANNGDVGDGAVLVYEKNKECKWVLVATLLGDTFSRNFGLAVALSGDGNTLVVGDPLDTEGNKGAVYIFRRNDKCKWAKVNKLGGSSRYSVQNGQFGYGFSVAINETGNVLAVGDLLNNENQNGVTGVGAVWTYQLDGNCKWKQTGKLFGDQRYSVLFGFALSLSNDGKRLVVGDINDIENGITNGAGRGSAYVYYLQDDCKWKRQSKLLPSATFGNQFGDVVNFSGNGTTLVVGDPNDSENGTDVGAVSIYTLNCESKWKLQTKILGSTRYSGSFGFQAVLSQDGTVLFIGDPNNSEVGLINGGGRGAVWKYKLIDCKWKRQDTILGDSRFSANYGVGIDISRDGTIAIIGDEANTEAGLSGGVGVGAAFIIEKPIN